MGQITHTLQSGVSRDLASVAPDLMPAAAASPAPDPVTGIRTKTSDFILEGFKFGSVIFGTPSGTITWSIAVTNFVAREQYDFTLSRLGFEAAPILGKAFATWASYANLTFLQVTDGPAVDIRFGMGNFDGRSGVLARTSTTFSGAETLYADIEFDAAEVYSPTGGGNSVNFRQVALHEIGHALGLDHEDRVPALMNSILSPTITGPIDDDIAGIRAIYGAAPPPPSSVSPSFAALFNDQFYLAQNPDVAAAGVNPKAHYLAFGSKEGRDPNRLFDTDYYLARNPDVRNAGVNPLEHYASFGFRESRDPGPSFDVDLYLQANQDVRLVGIDPLTHYLNFGEAEGRAIFPAV
ncbi:MAG: matrixin family metalloprotease [Alphaproteobacteria bacterium]|nr:matrixin family metalloprotease [Alphaproteobacteria bacterium]